MFDRLRGGQPPPLPPLYVLGLKTFFVWSRLEARGLYGLTTPSNFYLMFWRKHKCNNVFPRITWNDPPSPQKSNDRPYRKRDGTRKVSLVVRPPYFFSSWTQRRTWLGLLSAWGKVFLRTLLHSVGEQIVRLEKSASYRLLFYHSCAVFG